MSLKISFTYKNLLPNEKEQAERYVMEKVEKIEKRMTSVEAFLRVRIEKYVKKAAYQVELELKMPKKSFMASEDDHTISEAVDFSIDKLMKQVKRASGLNRPSHHKYPRARAVHARWTAFEEMLEPAASAASEREEFFETAGALVTSLVRTLQHEVRVRGLEKEEDVAPETIVDEAVLKVWDERAQKPPRMTFRQWLYQTAFAVLDERARRPARNEEEYQSLERVLPEESEASQVSNLGDEVKDFWQPDELTTLADTIGETKRKGGLAPSQRAQYHRVLAALTGFTPQARQAFLLKYKEGFEADEIAMIQRRSLPVVEKDLKEAVARLRTQLN